MVQQYFREGTASFFITFLKADGSDDPTVTNPTITIKHYDTVNNVMVTDIDATAMTQIDTTNQYRYEYIIPVDADFGTYLVTYNANVDGSDLETAENFQVISCDVPYATGGYVPSGTRIAQIKAKYGLGYTDLQMTYAIQSARTYMTNKAWEEVVQIINSKNTVFKMCNYVQDSNFDYVVNSSDIKVEEYMDKEPYTINDLTTNISSVTLNHPAGFSLITMDDEYPSDGFKLRISYLRGDKSFDDKKNDIMLMEELLTIYYLFEIVEINSLQRGLPDRTINDVTIRFDQAGIDTYRKFLKSQINGLMFNLKPMETCQYNSLGGGSTSPMLRSVRINKGY